MADIANIYKADASRYDLMQYNRVGKKWLEISGSFARLLA